MLSLSYNTLYLSKIHQQDQTSSSYHIQKTGVSWGSLPRYLSSFSCKPVWLCLLWLLRLIARSLCVLRRIYGVVGSDTAPEAPEATFVELVFESGFVVVVEG